MKINYGFLNLLFAASLLGGGVQALQAKASSSPVAGSDQQKLNQWTNQLIRLEVNRGIPQAKAAKVAAHIQMLRRPTKECPIANVAGVSLRVMVMRHGEQPSAADVKTGLGMMFDQDVTNRGLIRSFALVPLFSPVDLIRTNVNGIANGRHVPKYLPNNNPPVYGVPSAIIAPSVNATTAENVAYNNKNSDRSRQVVQQVANQNKLAIDDSFKYVLGNAQDPNAWTNSDNYCEIVQKIANFSNGTKAPAPLVLVAWDHKALPALVQEITWAFGKIVLPADLMPDANFHNYDRFYEITIMDGKIKSVKNLAQALIFGDTGPETSQTFQVNIAKPTELIKTKGPDTGEVLRNVLANFLILSKS